MIRKVGMMIKRLKCKLGFHEFELKSTAYDHRKMPTTRTFHVKCKHCAKEEKWDAGIVDYSKNPLISKWNKEIDI